MGGDHAPAYPVAGAILAVKQLGADIVLVGREAEIKSALGRTSFVGEMDVFHADDVVTMDDAPTTALRQKRQSSIHAAARLLRDGEVQGFVSAGNTGAVMVTVKTLVGSLVGIDRPALAVPFPNVHSHTVLLDVGANLNPRPRQLVQFAVMGQEFVRHILDVESPRVGLLSIGEEVGKGTDLIRRAYDYLNHSELNFLGNVEARDIYNGRADVVVCDGFTGNVVLKTGEATAGILGQILREELKSSLSGKLGAWLARNSFARFKQRVDWAEFGGAPLLGVRGLCVICHGRSTPRAIMNGVRVAIEHGRERVDQRIEQALAGLQRPAVEQQEDGPPGNASLPTSA